MAWSVSHISLVFLAMSVYYIHTHASSTATQSDYPSGSLACKTYNKTKMDCSKRSLPDVPVLDQNLTTVLDLSQNELRNITSAPFEKLHILLMLNLSYNEIYQMSSTTFRGLKSLESLDLQRNKLVDLPQMIFSDLHNLKYLDMNTNWFRAIPGQVLAPLYSLRYLSFMNYGDIHEVNVESLQNMTHLSSLHLVVQPIKTNISSNTLYPLRKLPLRVFSFGWAWADIGPSISKDVFSLLTSNITHMETIFTALPSLPSLQYPCQNLVIIVDVTCPQVLDSSSLQVLQKWNASLESLSLPLVFLERVEDYAFIWISNLYVLDLGNNKINYLARHAFYGLSSLQQLLLHDNLLTSIPSEALEIFRKYGSLQYLDLSSNEISKHVDQDAFSAVATTLSYLNFEVNDEAVGYTDWIGLLQNLKHLIFTCTTCTIHITSERSLPLLQTIQVISMSEVIFETPLCTLFPSLKLTRWSSQSIADFQSFPLHQAVQGCTNLKELDLSGVLQNTNLIDFMHLNITMSKLETLTLASNKLRSVEVFFFINAPKLAYLDLTGNSIKKIGSEIANKYPDLIYLNVQDNDLTSLSGLEHLTFLQNLKAGSNKITGTAPCLLSGARSLQTLDLNNNPFQCTCKIEHFKKWIKSDKKTWLQPGELYVCATPDNLKGISITAVELDCRSKTIFYLSVTIPSVLCLRAVLISVYQYRWHIKYRLFLLYRNYHQFPNNDEDFEMLQLQYHAYVAYNENSAEDDAWVLDELQPNMEEGLEPLRLCIKSRDFTPGHFLLDSIDKSIHQSRKTILVLSPNFVASEWCYHEMQMAQMRLLDDNLDVVVLVLLDAIPENKMTLSLRQLLCKKEYLKWPKNKVGQRLFWQRLRQEIKGPVHVDRCFQC